MGVSCLVSTGKHEVLDRFAFEIANIWLDVLGEIKEQENQSEDERCVPYFGSRELIALTAHHAAA